MTNLEFEVGLKVCPIKGAMRFCKKVKLAHRIISPFQSFSRVGALAYRLVLHSSMSNVYNIFHMSMLRNYMSNLIHALSEHSLLIKDKATHIKWLIKII